MRQIDRRRRGFTLIELLVVVLILAILMAVALPLYLSAVENAERRTCRSNLQTISNAVQAYRVKYTLPDYSSLFGPVGAALMPNLQSIPMCPTGGTYSVAAGSGGNTTYKVSCTLHGSFEPGVDDS